MKIAKVLRGILALSLNGLLLSCATNLSNKGKPDFNSSSSPKVSGYQVAIDQAFADLNYLERSRSPANKSPELAQFEQNFDKTEYFTITVFPKFGELSNQREKAGVKVNIGKPIGFNFRKLKQGKCALGADLVPRDQMDSCVQVEIKPVDPAEERQFVRVFMKPDYSVFGVSYHEYNQKTQTIKAKRQMQKWDPREPLSSGVLSLSKDIVPLDLPVHANNLVQQSDVKTLSYPLNPNVAKALVKNKSCDGVKFRYRNSYGSLVNASWCLSDPWPTYVETSRYIAVLSSIDGRVK